jgi:sec-independent protein translocase protein TatC
MFKFLFGKLLEKKDNMTFWEHADELRMRLIWSFIAITVFSVVAFFFKDIIFDQIILGPKSKDFITYKWFCKLGQLIHSDSLCIGDLKFSLINLDLGGQFRWHILISFIAGLIISFPFIAYQLWLFIKPALKPNELKYSRLMTFYITLLFIMGTLFGYYIISPLTINFLANYELSSEIHNQITIGSYISTAVILPLITGLVFELLVLVYFLTKISILSPSFLRKYRKHSFIFILILAAIITPSTDAFTMFVVALPIYLLFELSIFISKISYKGEIILDEESETV